MGLEPILFSGLSIKYLLPSLQHLTYPPGLGDAATRREGQVAVKDLADAA